MKNIERMGRQSLSCCLKQKLRKGLWSPEEDEKLFNHVTRFGVGCWSSVPEMAGLRRCGKSCRLRWLNYLRPDLKRGMFSQEEEDLILDLHKILGNRWAQIAARMPGRTDNEIKNFWNSCLKKKLVKQGIDPATHGSLPTERIQVKKEETSTEKGSFRVPLESNYGRPKESPFLVSDNESEHFATEHSILDPLQNFACNPVSADPYCRNSTANIWTIDQPRLPSTMPGLVEFDHHLEGEFSDYRWDSRMSWLLFDANEGMKLEEEEGSAWEQDQFLHVDYGLPSFSSPGVDDDDDGGGLLVTNFDDIHFHPI